jgi:hypothetical protein
MDSSEINIYALEEYQKYLEVYFEAFNKLDETRELSNDGIEIIYFIDFSEILGYFFPIEDIRKVQRRLWRSDNFEFFQFRIALNFIFEELPKLYILPSHNLELNNYLNSSIYDIGINILMNSELKNEFDLFKGEINSLFSNNLKDEKFKNTDLVLSDNDGETIIDLIEKYYVRLKAFRILTHLNGRKSLDIHLNKKLLKYKVIEDYLNIDTDLNKVIIDSKPWFYYFIKHRSYHTDYANYNDALAAVYIYNFNMFCINNKIPKRGILITRARRFSKFIDQLIDLKYNNKKISYTRSLEHFIIYKLFSSLEKGNNNDIFITLREDFN